MKSRTIHIFRTFLAPLALALAFVLLPQFAHAADLFFNPASGNVKVDSTFNVQVMVSSTDQAANGYSGVVAFPKDKLQVVSIQKAGIVNFWAQEPGYSNSAATVNFEGVTLTPGYTGAAGIVITIQFRALSIGSATLSFTDGSVLANDGNGTNILKTKRSAAYNIVPAGPAPVTPTVTSVKSPVISSPTHPRQDQWYANANPQFTWLLPNTITGVRTSFSSTVDEYPGATSIPPTSSQSFQGVTNGVHYFNARFRDTEGNWGATSHYKILVDIEKPENFDITFPDGDASENTHADIQFGTTDRISGMDYYLLSVDGQASTSLDKETAFHPYRIQFDGPGKHIITVKAFDRAGNNTSATGVYSVTPLPLPLITSYTKAVGKGEKFEVYGTTKPNLKVLISVNSKYEKIGVREAQADGTGNFHLIWGADLPDGTYSFNAVAKNDEGGLSYPTADLSFVVNTTTIFSKIFAVIDVLALVVFFLLLILLFAYIIWRLWHHYKKMRQKMLNELSELRAFVHRDFHSLHQDVKDYLLLLEKEKKELTPDEQVLINQIKKDISEIDKFIK